MIARARLVAGLVVVAAVAAAGALLFGRMRLQDPPAATRAATGSMLPSLGEAAGWLNGGPIGADSLRGHPTALVLWSDTDPRSLEALPVIETWHRAFARYGARVLGVHVPDYSFGADSAVPARAARRLGLTFPIALDPQYRIRIEHGPSRPLILVADTSGRIVFHGDGDRLGEADLALRNQVRSLHPEIHFPADPGLALAATPEPEAEPRFVFLGTSRVATGPLAGAQPGRTLTFTAQFRYQEEGVPLVPYPVGRWTPSAEGLTAARGGAMNYVAIRGPGGRVSVVMRPPIEGPVRVWILANDAWLDPASRAEDVRVDARGATYVEVDEPRLYRIARGDHERVLKLSPEQGGVTLYAFAFEPQDGADAAAESTRPAGPTP